MCRKVLGLLVIYISAWMCLYCIAYFLLTAGARWAIAEFGKTDAKLVMSIEKTQARVVLIDGLICVTEGTVTRADDGMTVIAYYHYWDGAIYNKIINSVNPDYPVNTVIPIVYSVGDAIGSCFAAGFYGERALTAGMIGMALAALGCFIIFGKWKGKKGNGKKEDYSRQLENEHDTQ